MTLVNLMNMLRLYSGWTLSLTMLDNEQNIQTRTCQCTEAFGDGFMNIRSGGVIDQNQNFRAERDRISQSKCNKKVHDARWIHILKQADHIAIEIQCR